MNSILSARGYILQHNKNVKSGLGIRSGRQESRDIAMIRTGSVFRMLSSIRVRWILALFILAAAASKAGETGIQAKRAADFVDSMGINVHMKYTNTPYGDTERIYEALQALGMRHFRDEINDTAPWFVARLKHIGSLGYTLCGLIEGGNDYPSPSSKLEAGAVTPMIAN